MILKLKLTKMAINFSKIYLKIFNNQNLKRILAIYNKINYNNNNNLKINL